MKKINDTKEPKVKCMECVYCVYDTKNDRNLCDVMMMEEPVVIPKNKIGCDSGFPLSEVYPEDEYYERLIDKIC